MVTSTYLIMILVHYNTCFCIILISVNFSTSLKIGIEIHAFDPAGRETSLLYDGGNVEISCWYNAYGEGDLELYAKDLVTGRFNHTYVKLETGNNSLLQYKISLQPARVLTSYMCTKGRVKSPVIYIFYNLCNPMSVEPRRVCPVSGEFCHMTKEGSTECKRLKDADCLYHRENSYIWYTRQLLPKFSAVCGSTKSTKFGLCYSLSNLSSQSIRYLTKVDKGCSPNFRLYICIHDCDISKKMTVMTGWDFLDTVDPFSVHVEVDGLGVSNPIACNIAYTENRTVRSKKVAFVAHKDNRGNAPAIVWQLKQLPTPNVADIVCDVIYKDEALLKYRTSLLVFRSDRDLRHTAKQKRIGLGSDKKSIDKLTINVSVADGLGVCVEKVRRGCIPAEGKDMRTAEVTISYKQEDYNFYVRLFASSPKQKLVLIYQKTIRYTNATFKKDNSGLKYKIAFIIAAAITITAVAAMTIFAVIWTRKRKGSRRRDHGTAQLAVYPKLVPQSHPRDVQTSTTSDRVYLREVWTTTKSLYPKEPICSEPPSQSDIYGTWKTGNHTYETVNPKVEY